MSKAKRKRINMRFNEEFIQLCTDTAAKRGQNLTEFTEQGMILNLTRTPIKYKPVDEASE